MTDTKPVDTTDLEKEILFEALQRSDAARGSYVEEACGDDAAMAGRIRKLLGAHVQAGAFLAAPTAGAVDGQPESGAVNSGVAEGPGSRLGPYRLVAVLGEGGFGKVFLAKQEEPVVRHVAIKVVRPGMDSRQVMARFDAERQALALMTHPGIARIFDAGATDEGRPFFVMEYVEGEPLTGYCDRRSLPVRMRLRIFEKVCLAVHHAHQKGVIHRDLKPTNVLVTEHDGEPVPKVIDFGIAKAIEQPLTGEVLETGALQLLGTPQYMSPEQARAGGSDVDTRADVYALGALLYELLVGTPPLDADRLDGADIADVQRLVCEEMPPRPSVRFGMLPPQAADRIADERDADYTELRSALRGDLDWITLKALEKERRRRYDSAAELAHDLQRHLEDEPVGARSPSAVYVLGKFVRRHQVAATSGIAIAAALLIGLVLAVVGLQRASQQADLAEDALETAQVRLWDSLVAQARAGRGGDRPGRRFESLAALRDAAKIRVAPELRDEAIACLTLADVQRRLTLEEVRIPSVKGLRVVDRIAYATVDADVRVESVPDGTTIADLSDGDFTPVSLRFSPGGRYLAVLSVRDGRRLLRVWDLERGVAVIDVPHERYQPNGLTFDAGSPSARWVAISERDGAVHVYRLPDGTAWRRIPVPGGEIHVAGGPDGRRLAITDNGPGLVIHDLDTDAELIRVTPEALPRSLAWSRAGVLAMGAGDTNVYLLRAEDGAPLATMSGHQAHVVEADFNTDGTLLATYGWDNTVRLWDVEAGAPFLGPMRGSWLGGFGDTLATYAQGVAEIWSIERGVAYRREQTDELFGSPARIAVSPDGRWLATSGANGILLWDAETLAPRGVVTNEPARSADFHPDGKTLVGTTVNGLYRWTIEEGDDALVARDETVLARLRRVRASAPGAGWRTVWVVDRDGAHEVDFDRGVLRTIPAYAGMATRPSASPDGRWLFTGAWKGEPAALWDLETLEAVRRFDATHVVGAFSPDGRWLGVGTGSVFRFLEVGTWRDVHEFVRDNADDLAGAIRFSDDGSMVAAGHSRFVIRLLRPDTGEVLAALENPDGLASSEYAFGPAASVLASVTPHTSVFEWDLRAIRAELARLGIDWE